MSHSWVLVLALLLDAIIGEPRWLWSRLPHPAVVMGKAVGWIDRVMNSSPHQRAKGLVSFAALILATWGLGAFVAALPGGWVIELVLATFLLAQRSLVDHVASVAVALRQSLDAGRCEVAKIVGRDTSTLDPSGVSRGAIESAAENLSDGVVAPAFWFLLLGLPGLLVYKITNTADSMIGYQTPRHRDFGWAAARFDDLINLLPARLTALLIVIVHGRFDAWRVLRRDATLHRSPNAGWPETAMAVTLNVALSGPRSYDGKMQDFPFVHRDGRRDPGADDIQAAVKALWRTWAALLALVIVSAIA